jgi:signal transduction histidine kinase
MREKEEQYKKLVEKEKQARERAEDAIKARDEFLSIASHELKTPLTTITLRIQSTLDSILNNTLANFSGEKLVGSLNIAHEQTRRLQMLIKDLLDFSLITRGKLDLQYKEGNLNDIVKGTIDRFEDHLELAGCSLKLETTGEINGLWDQIRLEQALSNLLTNAIKYGEGSPIEVDIQKEGNTAKISVKDNGIGIDSKKQKAIFDRFQRATDDEKFQGLGVGLFIVKQIIDAHGGKVSVKSKLGNGSTFIIELPIKEKMKDENTSHHIATTAANP